LETLQQREAPVLKSSKPPSITEALKPYHYPKDEDGTPMFAPDLDHKGEYVHGPSRFLEPASSHEEHADQGSGT
jgi:hypothetical protein